MRYFGACIDMFSFGVALACGLCSPVRKIKLLSKIV